MFKGTLKTVLFTQAFDGPYNNIRVASAITFSFAIDMLNGGANLLLLLFHGPGRREQTQDG